LDIFRLNIRRAEAVCEAWAEEAGGVRV